MKYIVFVCWPIFIFSAITASAQEFAASDSITKYHQLVDAKNFEQSARLAMVIGNFYLAQTDVAVAKKYYDYAFMDSDKAKSRTLEARALFKLGMAEKKLAESGKFSMDQEQDYYRDAVDHFKKAHTLFRKSNLAESYEHVTALVQGAEAQYILGDFKEAIDALQIALKMAQKQRMNDLAYKASDLLVKNFDALHDNVNRTYYQSVSQNYKDYFISKDSIAQQGQAIEKLEATKKIQEQQLQLKQSEIERKNLEIENQKTTAEKNAALLRQRELERKMMIGGIGVIFIFLIIAYMAYRFARRSNRKLSEKNRQITSQKAEIEKRQVELGKEKSKTDRLLLSILPKPVAEELKNNGRVVPRYYKNVTILFTDFKGFTGIAERLTPGEIVRELEACFYAFDNIIEKYHLEKIKTIGDGYMCAGGVPLPNDTNALDAVRAAIEMLQFMHTRKQAKQAKGEPYFELRIGINTGPVVAGVVGKNKFAYDIWGDAVNLASRMESSGEVGRINISGSTYQLVKDHFFFTYRGRINAKNKGEVDMYFVDGRVKYSDKKTEVQSSK